jgi:hypothetical protein
MLRAGFACELAVAEPHDPANTEKSADKTHETISAVVQTIAIRLLGDNAQYYRREETEQESGFEMGKIHLGH